MQMQINTGGIGLSIPKSGFGFNILSAAYLNFRHTMKSDIHLTLVIGKSFTIGSRSGTIIGSIVRTEWFDVDLDKHTWLNNPHELLGKEGEVEVIGTTIGTSIVDIKFSLINSKSEIQPLISKVNINTTGVFQVASTKVRGIIKYIPSKKL